VTRKSSFFVFFVRRFSYKCFGRCCPEFQPLIRMSGRGEHDDDLKRHRRQRFRRGILPVG
jgi:hypothetical protein